MARVLTDRNPKVKSAELWGCIRFPGLANDRLRFLYRYAAPDEYLLLLALDEENATFLASDAKGTVIYDPRRGHVLVVSDVIPTFYMGLQANALEFKWGFVGKSSRPSTESATEPADKLILDIPSLLRNRNVVRHEVELTTEGTRRLILTGIDGDRMISTVDTTAPFEYTDFQIENADGRTQFKMRVNHALSAAPHLPDIKTIGTMFKVEQLTAPMNWEGLGRIMETSFTSIAALATTDSSLREWLDSGFSQKKNWGEIEKRLKRDLPKLRRLLPTPP
jgi:hypothetical protein